VDLLVINVPGSVSRNEKTHGLQHLKFIYVAVDRESLDRACLVHHGADELLVEQDATYDAQTTPPVEERAYEIQSLSLRVSRPGKLCVKGYHKVSCSFNTLY
jgi:hypothetical protein